MLIFNKVRKIQHETNENQNMCLNRHSDFAIETK